MRVTSKYELSGDSVDGRKNSYMEGGSNLFNDVECSFYLTSNDRPVRRRSRSTESQGLDRSSRRIFRGTIVILG
jgi:hypothetical protein